MHSRLKKGSTLSGCSVSYDTSLLDGGFKVIKHDSEKEIYTCIPNEFTRFFMIEEQHQAQLHALANTARAYTHQDTTARPHNPCGNVAASSQVLTPSVLPPPTIPPPEIIPAIVAKEGEGWKDCLTALTQPSLLGTIRTHNLEVTRVPGYAG